MSHCGEEVLDVLQDGMLNDERKSIGNLKKKITRLFKLLLRHLQSK